MLQHWYTAWWLLPIWFVVAWLLLAAIAGCAKGSWEAYVIIRAHRRSLRD
jgi:hypothetical protein